MRKRDKNSIRLGWQRKVRLSLESLEDRRLLAASPVSATPVIAQLAPELIGSIGHTSLPDSLSNGEPFYEPAFRRSVHAGNVIPAASSSAYGLFPDQIRGAYGIDSITFSSGTIVGDGTGQTIAIVDAYNAPTIVSDLHQFDLQFGLPDPPNFTVVGQTGGALPGNDPAGPGNSWAVETSLDVEWAHAIAPKANILLYAF
jgi:subtilase family serine protease